MFSKLAEKLINIVSKRTPNRYIGGVDDPYLIRWYIIPRNKLFNIYLHNFKRSDDDRALHDHPWPWLSILLRNSYLEHTPTGVFERAEGSWRINRPTAAHRVELHKGDVWTLFVTGPRVRDWGFHCPQGWKNWKLFCDPVNPDERGPGCD